ncbi:MAG: heavy metal sensor histidine kinase [Burkholderiaceae bacterium]
MNTAAHPSANCTPCAYSIGKRLSLLLATQTVIGLGLLLALAYAATHMLFTNKQEEELRSYTTILADVLQEAYVQGGEADMMSKLAWLSERRPGTFVQVMRANDSEIYRDQSPTFDVDNAPTRAMTFNVAADGNPTAYHGRLVLDCSDDTRHARRMAWLLILATLAGGASVAWATYWRVRCHLRPLLDLAAQTRAIDVRRPDQRLHLPVAIEELQPLVEQVNGLMERVQASYVQLEGFNADVAHELRTPLANLIGHTELALSRERSNEELTDTLAGNLEELHRLAGIINDMLFLSQADRGIKARRGQPVSLADLVRQVIEFHEAPMEEAGLGIDIEGDVRLPVDEALIKRALSNLLGNAIQYAEQGTRLRVHLAAEPDGGARLWVENTGPAIRPEYLPRLFDRFFRADASRCEIERPHHGLGLSIVAAIARMHDGLASAESANGRTRIGFSLHGSSPAATA